MSTDKGLTFILGLPFSGSSLFALALGNAKGFINCGEMNYLENDWHAQRTCSCGAAVANCAFWGPVQMAMQEEITAGRPGLRLTGTAKLHPLDARNQPMLRKLGFLLKRPLASIFGGASLDRYVADHTALAHHILDRFNANQVVDSSKSARRLAVLLERSDMPIRVIVIERTMAESLGARVKRARRRNRFYVQAMVPVYIGWLLYHLAQMRNVLRHVPHDRLFRLSYHQLVTAPSEVEQQLSDWYGDPVQLGIDEANVLQAPDAHVYTGNIWLTRMKGMQDGVVIRPPAAKPELTPVEHTFFRMAARMLPSLRKGI